MTNRREWLKSAAACAGLAGLRPDLLWAATPGDAMLGVQLWSVHDLLQKEFEPTLRSLAGLGFRRVEAAGWQNHTPEAFRKAVEAAGLHCDSAHFGMEAIAADARGAVAQTRDAGCEYLICASPFLPGPLPKDVEWTAAVMQVMTVDAWQRTADLLNEAAAAAAPAGIKVGYHNHVAEFARYQGQVGYDLLLAHTDPAAVRLEVDLAWAAAGGQDPVALIEAQKARIVRLHLKDVRSRPRPGEISTGHVTVPPGSGVLDWKSILVAARKAGIPGAYLEVEEPYVKSPLDDLASGRAHLAKILATI